MFEYDFKNLEIADIVNNIIIYAVSKKASDIHFDPASNCINVRIRIDGELHDYAKIPDSVATQYIWGFDCDECFV